MKPLTAAQYKLMAKFSSLRNKNHNKNSKEEYFAAFNKLKQIYLNEF